MEYSTKIEEALKDPKQLEALYRQARQEGWETKFAQEIAQRHAYGPEDVLVAAWYYRLHGVGPAAEAAPLDLANWRLAVPLSLLLALVYGLLSQHPFDLAQGMPYIMLGWAPAAALTMNRTTIIGWNVINIALLGLYLFRQWRGGLVGWIPSSQATFRVGMVAYAVWAVFVILAMPLLFRL